ncbi:glutathione S-transferase family protein [Stenotrophomonas sp. SY1]|uniref:glutathione S-transferase family protein n=1 Tax=Stenotrophomonas sp. SY1 TaxID=477235 RepID=UPI001E49851E|nr:glutathione S-transferase family protein [Stenotrophomonas sp. SY1]MCD9087598.1 glutathione S-transferase family protein [Stenotrophomonas sp. SY1]
MTATLTFYTHPNSRGRLARWMLEETGLPYEEVLLEFGTSMKSADYRAINPMGKVPALRHGEAVVTENAAICAYLAELVPEKQLAPPPGSVERAAYYRWLFFMSGPFEAWLTAKSIGTLAPAMGAGYGADGDVLDTLEQAVTGRAHLAGDHFTAVDLYVAASLSYFMMIGVVEKRPAFEVFAARHVSRPASVAANNRDNALAAAAG